MTIYSILTINLLLYVVMAYLYGRQSKMSFSFILSSYYVIIAALGLFIVQNGIYENVYFLRKNQMFSIIPYICCLICLAILICPFKNLSYTRIRFEEIPYNKSTEFIINIWIVNILLYLLLKFSQAIIASALGYDTIYTLTAVDGEGSSFFYGNNLLLQKFNNFNVNLYHSFTPFVMCYALYGRVTHKLSSQRVYFIILLIFIVQVLSALANGSRGNLFFTIWSFVFYYILFFKHLDIKDKKIITKSFLCFFLLVLIYSIKISISRVSSSNSELPFENILRYFGEAYPNLGNLFWNNVDNHPWGTRLFPYIFGDKYTALSVQDGYSFWRNYTGVPVLNFKTLYGDLYIEFGPIIPFIIVSIISFFFYIFLNKGKISFWKISLIYWYFDLIIQGVFGFNKGGRSNLIVLIAIILVSSIVKLYTKKRSI